MLELTFIVGIIRLRGTLKRESPCAVRPEGFRAEMQIITQWLHLLLQQTRLH